MLAMTLEPHLELDTRVELTAHARISEKGRVVIPIQFREALGIKAGDVVSLSLVDDELRISTFASRLERARKRVRRLAPSGTSAVDELIAERRTAAAREEEESQAWLQNPHA